jgi:hypothetical protein
LLLTPSSWPALRDGKSKTHAEPDGIALWSDGSKLLGHFIIRNAGNLPASEVAWIAHIALDRDRSRSSFPVDETGLKGNLTIPPKGAMPFGSPLIGLQAVLDFRKNTDTCYLYVWGLVRYQDGFSMRRAHFWHRYDYGQTRDLGAGEYELPANKGRHHSVAKPTSMPWWRRVSPRNAHIRAFNRQLPPS